MTSLSCFVRKSEQAVNGFCKRLGLRWRKKRPQLLRWCSFGVTALSVILAGRIEGREIGLAHMVPEFGYGSFVYPRKASSEIVGHKRPTITLGAQFGKGGLERNPGVFKLRVFSSLDIFGPALVIVSDPQDVKDVADGKATEKCNYVIIPALFVIGILCGWWIYGWQIRHVASPPVGGVRGSTGTSPNPATEGRFWKAGKTEDLHSRRGGTK